jgi:hypothetical protein
MFKIWNKNLKDYELGASLFFYRAAMDEAVYEDLKKKKSEGPVIILTENSPVTLYNKFSSNMLNRMLLSF